MIFFYLFVWDFFQYIYLKKRKKKLPHTLLNALSTTNLFFFHQLSVTYWSFIISCLLNETSILMQVFFS